MVVSAVSLTQIPMIPVILDLLVPLNGSRDKIILVPADYIIDPLEYYFELHLFMTTGAFLVLFTFVSIDVTYLMSAHQILGIYRIVELVF